MDQRLTDNLLNKAIAFEAEGKNDEAVFLIECVYAAFDGAIKPKPATRAIQSAKPRRRVLSSERSANPIARAQSNEPFFQFWEVANDRSFAVRLVSSRD